jgi:hypothetical protein
VRVVQEISWFANRLRFIVDVTYKKQRVKSHDKKINDNLLFYKWLK